MRGSAVSRRNRLIPSALGAPATALAVRIQRRDTDVSLGEASHLQPDHGQVELVRVVDSLVGIARLSFYSQLAEEYLAEVRQVDHVTEWGSGSTSDTSHQRAFQLAISVQHRTVFGVLLCRPLRKVLRGRNPFILR